MLSTHPTNQPTILLFFFFGRYGAPIGRQDAKIFYNDVIIGSLFMTVLKFEEDSLKNATSRHKLLFDVFGRSMAPYDG